MDFKIDFIGIGAARSGSTWLTDCLAAHPSIYIPRIKETAFFLKPVFEKKYTKDLAWYESFFKNAPRESVKGEFTTHYMVESGTARRIKKIFPQVKLLVCLRNPADMLYSLYWWRRASFSVNEIPDTFEKALKSDPVYKKRGNYYKLLKPYFDIFGRKHIKVILFDDIRNNPEKILSDVYKYLGVDSSFAPPPINSKVNAGRQIRSKNIALCVNYIVKIARVLDLHYFLRAFGNYGVTGRLYSFITQKQKKYPDMKTSTRKVLVKLFRSDVEKLEKLIDKDLSAWNS